MIQILEDHRPDIETLCRRYDVVCLEVFGSAVDDTFDPQKSDIDFLVEFIPLEPGPLATAYFGLLNDLKNLFNRDIDLLTQKAIRNPYLLKSINRTRRAYYAA